MSVKHTSEKILIEFGQNNSPVFVAMGIAVAKGIFRPAFTMMDKEESYETKRYTAMREGLTELIAIPVYFLSGVASKMVSKKLSVPKNFMPKKLYKQFQSGKQSPEIDNSVKRAQELAKINLPKITTTTSFIGVCISALFLIPLICSATIKPIMAQMEKKNSEQKKKEDVVGPVQIQKPDKKLVTFNGLYRSNNYGMKVGGV